MLIDKIYKDAADGKKSLALLLDPDEFNLRQVEQLFADNYDHVSYIFVGGSLLQNNELDNLITHVKKITKKPVILFPGNASHISSKADAILFLSLVSGRNPEFLIGQQVISAPIIKKAGLEAFSTAYMLIDGGRPTTVQYVSNTFPIPSDKPEIAACTALAAKYLGFKLTYLDAGSGAQNSISQEMIKSVKNECEMPLIVGGGIRNYEDMEAAFDAGADIVVIGNALEKSGIKISELQSNYLK
jgi:putative glycerol-1-phosphate prenyltransferase